LIHGLGFQNVKGGKKMQQEKNYFLFGMLLFLLFLGACAGTDYKHQHNEGVFGATGH